VARDAVPIEQTAGARRGCCRGGRACRRARHLLPGRLVRGRLHRRV